MRHHVLFVLFVSMAVAHADDYNMRGSIVCTSWHNVTHLCTSWSVSTKISTDVACFPGDSLVKTGHGYKMMSDLKVGDILYGYNDATQSIVPTFFTRWLHFEKNGEYEFIEIQTSSPSLNHHGKDDDDYGSVATTSSLIVSDYHNIAFWHNGQIVYDYATNADKYSMLFDGTSGIPITGINIVVKKGVYAPLTSSYNFVVTEANFLVHAFAYVPYPQMIEDAFGTMLRAVDAYWNIIIQTEFTDVSEYYDPSVKRIANVFGYLTDPVEPVKSTPRLRGLNARNSSPSSSGTNSQNAQNAENSKMRQLLSMSNFLLAHVATSNDNI